MLIERVRKYYNKEYDLNCAECMLVAANEEYDLNMSKQTLMTMASFGGGMSIGSVCGAVTGAIAVIGVMFTNERGHQSPHVREMTARLIEEFNRRMEALDCITLKQNYYKEDGQRCILMMEVATEVLQELIEEYRQVYSINR